MSVINGTATRKRNFQIMIDVNQEKTNHNQKTYTGKFNNFRRRYYSNPGDFWQDFRYMLSHRKIIKRAMREEQISPAFRERLMIAVTEVNQCRYCRAFHIQQAYQAGLSKEEIDSYLSGIIPEDIPVEEKIAVCFAQHWAENDGQHNKEYENQIRETYGKEGFNSILMILRMIRMGNLLGNTWDYFLYRISFGHWGQD
ncbi:MAG: carboxymuconolactone decarboxylase family protein [Anaerolineales bacterium]|nr:carboxymuconolactone decarboxylase family protein [Anaerolineales bacterium]